MNKMSQVILAELKSKLIEGLVSASQKRFICFQYLPGLKFSFYFTYKDINSEVYTPLSSTTYGTIFHNVALNYLINNQSNQD